MDTTVFIDVLGWIGALLVIIAYFMVSTRRVAGDALSYQLLNLSGGLLLIANTAFYGAYPSSVVNLVWVGIAVYALVTGRKHRAEELPPPAN